MDLKTSSRFFVINITSSASSGLLAVSAIVSGAAVHSPESSGCPVCLVLKQGAVNQIFLEVFLMFLACLDHEWWAQFHLGILGPQE